MSEVKNTPADAATPQQSEFSANAPIGYTQPKGTGLTFGEKLVGLSFNPSGDDKVTRAKKLCAELADLVHGDDSLRGDLTELQHHLYHHTIGEILNAQMNVVKLLTLKY
jgi:hypothetical protein